MDVEIVNEFFDMRVELMTVQFGSKYLSQKHFATCGLWHTGRYSLVHLSSDLRTSPCSKYGRNGHRRRFACRTTWLDTYSLLKSRYKIYRILQNGLANVGEYKPELELFNRATH